MARRAASIATTLLYFSSLARAHYGHIPITTVGDAFPTHLDYFVVSTTEVAVAVPVAVTPPVETEIATETETETETEIATVTAPLPEETPDSVIFPIPPLSPSPPMEAAPAPEVTTITLYALSVLQSALQTFPEYTPVPEVASIIEDPNAPVVVVPAPLVTFNPIPPIVEEDVVEPTSIISVIEDEATTVISNVGSAVSSAASEPIEVVTSELDGLVTVTSSATMTSETSTTLTTAVTTRVRTTSAADTQDAAPTAGANSVHGTHMVHAIAAAVVVGLVL